MGSNQTGAQSMGLHLHSTLVVTPECLPLGATADKNWLRQASQDIVGADQADFWDFCLNEWLRSGQVKSPEG